MSDDLDDFWIHTAQLETYTGQGSDGSDGYAGAVPVTGFLDGKRAVVSGPSGEEIVAASTFYVPAGAGAPFVPLSRVTFPGRTPLQVASVAPQDSGALELPDHVVVALI